jgi:hypothetical protein
VHYGQDGQDGDPSPSDGDASRRDGDASLAFALGLSRLVYPSRASHAHAHSTCPGTGPRSVTRRAQAGVSEGAASEVGAGMPMTIGLFWLCRSLFGYELGLV